MLQSRRRIALLLSRAFYCWSANGNPFRVVALISEFLAEKCWSAQDRFLQHFSAGETGLEVFAKIDRPTPKRRVKDHKALAARKRKVIECATKIRSDVN